MVVGHLAGRLGHRAAAWLLAAALAFTGGRGLAGSPGLPNAAAPAFADAGICSAHTPASPSQPDNGPQHSDCCLGFCCAATVAIVPPEAGIASPGFPAESAPSVLAAGDFPRAQALLVGHRPRAPPIHA